MYRYKQKNTEKNLLQFFSVNALDVVSKLLPYQVLAFYSPFFYS